MKCWNRAFFRVAVGLACLSFGLPARAAQEILYATTLNFATDSLLAFDPRTGSLLSAHPFTDIATRVYLRGLTYDGSSLWSTNQLTDDLFTSDQTVRIDPSTGALTVVGDTGFKWNFRSVEVDPRTGILYGMTDTSTPDRITGLSLFTIDKSTGAATRVFFGRVPTLEQPTAMAIDGSGTLYFTDTVGTGLFRVDLSTFQVTHLGDLNLGGLGQFEDLAFDRSGRLWGALFGGGLYTIDIENLTVQLQFPTVHLGGIAFSTPSAPPTALCKDVTVAAGPSCSADASIDNGSFDPDGGPVTLTQDPASPYSLGATLVRLTVEDDEGSSSTCEATVRVEDVTPPAIQQVSATLRQLWPPNHRMVPVTVSVQAVDNCHPVTCGITSVRSSEPVDGLGDGDTAPDWQILTSTTVSLRAERSGRGGGRIYTIGVECLDRAGNASPGEITVSVPHDRGK